MEIRHSPNPMLTRAAILASSAALFLSNPGTASAHPERPHQKLGESNTPALTAAQKALLREGIYYYDSGASGPSNVPSNVSKVPATRNMHPHAALGPVPAHARPAPSLSHTYKSKNLTTARPLIIEKDSDSNKYVDIALGVLIGMGALKLAQVALEERRFSRAQKLRDQRTQKLRDQF